MNKNHTEIILRARTRRVRKSRNGTRRSSRPLRGSPSTRGSTAARKASPRPKRMHSSAFMRGSSPRRFGPWGSRRSTESTGEWRSRSSSSANRSPTAAGTTTSTWDRARLTQPGSSIASWGPPSPSSSWIPAPRNR